MKKIYMIGLIVLGLLFALGCAIQPKSNKLVEVDGLYDSNGNLVKTGLSVVGGVEGVKYITLRVTVNNKDTVPLTFGIIEITPTEISSVKPTTKSSVEAGQSGVWVTNLIDIEPYEGLIQDFCVTVESDKIPTLRESSQASGCTSIKVDPNPSGNFDIGLDSSIGESDVNPGCEESWSCADWSDCVSGVQIRTCVDSAQCGTEQSKPEETQVCEGTSFSTNAVDGNYRDSSTWISINGITYYLKGRSTYECLTSDIILTTDEGYPICTRSGYDITERVYLYDGAGIIFKT